MASLRKKFRVSWDDREPVVITTSARDVVNSSTYTGSSEPIAATFGLIYAALVRHGHELPPYEDWLDLVDEVEDVGTVVDGLEGPTNGVPSGGVPSPSPAPPAPIGDPGSTATMTDPSLLPS